MLTKDLFDRLLALLSPEMDDTRSRKTTVKNALFNSPVLRKIVWDGDELTFTRALILELHNFKLDSGKPALMALLETIRNQVGQEQQQECNQLIAQLSSTTAATTPAIPAPPKTFEKDELYVFISFASPDQDIAEKVKTFLNAAGMRVFFAPESIGPGDNWITSIDHALRECQAMVLLMSPHSMPERKEVEREWNYFDLNRKPIYPLYLQQCEKHSRLVALNHTDAQTDLPGALEKVLKKLQHNFGIREARTSATQTSAEEKDADADPAPDPLTEYRRGRIAEWSKPRYDLDKRFVNLTLLLDKGESEMQRWQRAEDQRFNDLRDVLETAKDDAALVLLGAPGSGKSTLLRRLELDHSEDCLRAGGGRISFFIQLNRYNGDLPEPREWLAAQWKKQSPQLPPLESCLQTGQALLLLDALNEMPHRSAEHYRQLVERWRAFVQEAAEQGNRLVFSCRTLDYSALLSSPELRVPQVEVQPMNAEQVREFLKANAAEHEARIWQQLDGSPQFSLFQTPYFLKLLCEQVSATGEAPKGRAALFTGFVQRALHREIERGGEWFKPGTLLTDRDHRKLSLGGKGLGPFDLPEGGALIPRLSHLAFVMQQTRTKTESAQVRTGYDEACRQLAHDRAEDIIKAGIALNVLDEDVREDEVLFFHQLLQEYFAARCLAKEPDATLVHVEWEAAKVREPLAETLAKLADGDPLPPLPQTGWEETTLTAAPMAKDCAGFIRALMPHNLPLAARCAAAPEVTVSEDLKQEIRRKLIERTKDPNADLRARIAAGEALGLIGDPRFELRHGKHGDYLLPPLVDIPGGKYPMGTDDGEYEREGPVHSVELSAFQIGQFPVTNAEYKLFMDAGGYEDQQWWDTPESLAWLSGEAASEGAKQSWRDDRKTLLSWTDDYIRGLVKQNRITSKQADDWIVIRNWSEEEFEQQLEEWYPAGRAYRQPEFWDDARFNNPAQPVVGVTWFEARAYCNWLTANVNESAPRPVGSGCSLDGPLPTGRGTDPVFRLPTEAEFEAAARGKKGRLFPYGKTFDVDKCNTFESHIRRTTPIGIFDNATPEGAFDLSGNAYTWTLSIYDQDRFSYPYRSEDGREDVSATGVRRVLRGGSWNNIQDFARAVLRYFDHPAFRYYNPGFRVVLCRPPS
ncbi:MAG: SUMF1/EgtB/PvdO family nonheme iron enzyme [Acidobacteriota bacterium]